MDQNRRKLIITTLGLLATPAFGRTRTINFDVTSRQKVSTLNPVEVADGLTADALIDRPVLVTFFASWCPPCLEEFRHLNKLQVKYAESPLQIFAINVHEQWDDNDRERMVKFLNTTQPTFPVVKVSEEIRALFGGINRIPTVYGFDAAGKLRFDFVHASGATKTNATFAELDAAARLLLG